MIDRYTRPEMGHIFSLENKYAIWQEIEVLACEAQAELGKIGISKDEAQWIRDHANFEKAKVDEIEEVTRHDVIAFLTNMKEYIDADVPEGEPKPSRWVHYGMTSSDLGDTALCYQLTQACDLIIEDVKKLGVICKRRAFEERNTLCAGRTHGIHAEPMTFGMKFGSWAWELKRDLDRLEDARKNVAFGAISGAVGTYSSIEPFVEEYVCEHLGLVHDPLSTQVISRDHHAYLAGVLATTAATCERIATEVRNLQKTDTLEAEEPFRKGQKGSSAMPHKRNPITMEKVCGLSRVVKSNAQVAFDNVALWHERDISHSSAERVAQADSFIALDHMFQCLIRVIDGLQLYPARMMANLNKTRGLIFSSKVLLALVDTGITREDAYAIVQENAMATWHEVQDCVSGPTFKERLEADPRCTVSQEKLDEIFDPWDFLTRIDTVFDRLEQLNFE
ncbi:MULTISPECIES: adenylosuccinate lyase [unclassified Collinsella]|uniref:adenylosuccinate lyase n=1 Tax=unclassified Collinsella TaxID=2637548 RepID=UPI000E441FC4|nr:MULTISPECIES: adenylosuccinate lyase [unclassified Collinsella]MBS5461446.1 adenylosuccinate lyase [Collinsella sp.]RGK24021.1 adenylosuccinate lyase [Collinsella sp. TF12-2AT]RHA18937.1 adenylosuccinate lyase [Collinsella sp. AM44-11]